MDASAMMRPAIATLPRYGRFQGRCVSESGIAAALIALCPHSYWLSGSSGCFRSHNGRALATTGTVAKLYAGGGELVDHSSVHASQGSLPALAPLKYDTMRFATKMRTASAWMNAPTLTRRFKVSQPRPGSYV